MRSWITRCVIGLLFAVALAPAGAASEAPGPAPSYGPQDLHGALSGWGFTQLSINQPGPTITVSQFEATILDLFSFDTFSHTWLLDLNGNGGPDPLENQSAPFTSPTSPLRFTFVPTAAAGNYQYICGFHGASMSGPFVITPGNAQPTVSLTNPDGVAQNRWTGGSVKRLTWTMNDPDGLPSLLAVWLNYTSSAGSGPIVSPPTLPLGATFYDWTLPPIDAINVVVQITVADPGGATGTDASSVPIIDSTPPSVTTTDPIDTAVGIDPNAPVTITFSEAMTTLGPGSVTFNPPAGVLTLGWIPGNTILTVGHPTLTRATTYLVSVSDFRDASNPGNPMLPFSFSFTTANDPPAITVTQPTGTSRWSGGTPHTLQWAATDTEDAPSALTAWVNYSATGIAPFFPIGALQGIPGDVTTFVWTVPGDNTASARLRFTVNDTNGETASPLSPAFSIDSTAPTVTATTPANLDTNVPLNTNLVITFSEAMNQGATADAAVVGLREIATTSWIPLAFTWDAPGVLRADPVPALLVAATSYELLINSSASDTSDPGISLGSAVTVTFTTGVAADTTVPGVADVAAIPATTGTGGSVEISANVTDDVAVSTVAVIVTLPDLSTLNLTMVLGTGSRWAVAQTWTQAGTHPFVVWASDTSGNWASASGSFTITSVDTTPPTVTPTAHGSVRVGVSITIHAMVVDDGVVEEVWLVYTSVGGTGSNVTMVPSGDNYTFTIPGQVQAGTVTYRFYAIDDAGNEVFTEEFMVMVVAAPPASNTLLYVAIGLLVLAVLGAVIVLMIRRRRKDKPHADEGTSPPPSGN